MTRRGQKETERWILDRFFESLGKATPGLPSSFLEDENPDFRMGNSVPCPLGIEIVELNHLHAQGSGLRLRQEEGIRDHLCRTIKIRWDKASIPVAEVSLHLLGHKWPKKQEVLRLPDAILAVTRAHMPDEGGVSKVSRDDLWQHPILGRHVHSLTVARWPGLDRPYVTAPHAAFLPPLSHELLQSAFAKKNSKVPEYKRRCHSVWLIAVHNLSTLATHFSPHDSAVSDTYDLAFDRTFVFNAIRKESTEIRTQQ